MNKESRVEKMFNEYIYLINHIREYMHLYNWSIVLKGKDDLESDAQLSKCEYKYFNAEISFDNRKMLYNETIEIEAEEVCQLLVHEICHIFTGAGTSYISENGNFLDYNLGEKYTVTIFNTILRQEEMQTNIMDKFIMKSFKETNEYKKFEKEFNKLKKYILQ